MIDLDVVDKTSNRLNKMQSTKQTTNNLRTYNYLIQIKFFYEYYLLTNL